MEGNPGLSELLHEEGGTGLRLFGYEPERSLRVSGGFQCAAERDPTCPKSPPPGSALSASRNQQSIKRNVEVGVSVCRSMPHAGWLGRKRWTCFPASTS